MASGDDLELEDFRLMDAAETLVNLHSVQAAARAAVVNADDHAPSHMHHHRPPTRPSETLLMESSGASVSQQTQSIVDPSGTGVIFISTTPPSTSSTLHISPLSSPVLHHLTNVAPANFDPTDLEKSPSAAVNTHLAPVLEALSPSDASGSLRGLLQMHHDPNMAELDLSPAHRQRATPTHASNDDPFDLSLSSEHVPMGPPPTPRTPKYSPTMSMMRPPPPPGRRGRGGRRGSSLGRGRGRGRGRGSKGIEEQELDHKAKLSEDNNISLMNTNESVVSDTSNIENSNENQASDDCFEVGALRVPNSVLDQLLNERKLELLQDPSILMFIAQATRGSGLNRASLAALKHHK